MIDSNLTVYFEKFVFSFRGAINFCILEPKVLRDANER